MRTPDADAGTRNCVSPTRAGGDEQPVGEVRALYETAVPDTKPAPLVAT